jgi:hypothetical protein
MTYSDVFDKVSLFNTDLFVAKEQNVGGSWSSQHFKAKSRTDPARFCSKTRGHWILVPHARSSSTTTLQEVHMMRRKLPNANKVEVQDQRSWGFYRCCMLSCFDFELKTKK